MTDGMSPLLELRALRKAYGALQVTRNVSLTVAPGEIHALIGPNGAGKTTLVSQIAGTTRPDSGHILLAGRDITRLPPHRRARLGLARSFQIIDLVDDYTALENAALAVRDASPRARDALAAVNLAPRADTPAGALSHGERRHLELAIALAAAPTLLLLDEPMAGIGHDEAAALVVLLQSLRGRFAILLVEHDMDAVFALAGRISVLVEGALIATGPPAAIRADPLVRAAYLGDAPC